jgi:1-phosphatidylinositol phosphodiesterase
MDLKSEKWMSHIKDEAKISEITIPGTHNTCASKCSILAKCQNISLMEQLNSGVRFIDIRCCHSNDSFNLHHGNFKIECDFEHGVMGVCVQFLCSNPTETIIAMLKPEHMSKNNPSDFDEKFLSYVQKYKNFWYLNDTIPRLGDARGKIVLLRRFFSTRLPLGIDMSAWRDSQTFHVQNHPEFKFSIQDEYKLKAGPKWTSVMNLLRQAQEVETHDSIWHLNYASAANWPLQPPVYIAFRIKKHLNLHLNKLVSADTHKENGMNLGTIIIDFAEHEIVKNIFSINFTKNYKVLKNTQTADY